MGHGVGAAVTASVCMGSLRGTRRQGLSLLDQASSTNTAIAEHASARSSDDFVTGLIGRLDLQTGSLEIVNAGHVAPYLARGSGVTALGLRAALPFGMFPDTAYTSSHVVLEPGDRVVFVTDGMLEGSVAGLDLPEAIRTTRELHPREAVRAMADRALAVAGHELRDDAPVLCLDWHDRHAESRHSTSGADRDRASDRLE
jgi:serine phosphatase RsbU (regulator of sigma subunit)